MSLPRPGKLSVNVSVPAGKALALARRIQFFLSRMHDFQQQEIVEGTRRDYNSIPDGDRPYIPLDFTIGEHIRMVVIPDQPSPQSSAYGYYTAPGSDQYIPAPSQPIEDTVTTPTGETVIRQADDAMWVEYTPDEVGGYWVRKTSYGAQNIVSDRTLLDAILYELANGNGDSFSVMNPPQP